MAGCSEAPSLLCARSPEAVVWLQRKCCVWRAPAQLRVGLWAPCCLSSVLGQSIPGLEHAPAAQNSPVLPGSCNPCCCFYPSSHPCHGKLGIVPQTWEQGRRSVVMAAQSWE